MILPDFILPSRVNQRWQYSGLDSPEKCRDKKHFKSYPYTVEYCYNSRGYRDQEWPDNIEELKNAIWCIGDSFTVGLGSPVEHTWPYVLQQKTGRRIINVSMDGASNEWIARKVSTLLKIVRPTDIIIHWSYIERREKVKDNTLLNRHWVEHYNVVKGPDWPACPPLEQYDTLPSWILTELASHDQSWKDGLTDEQLKVGHIKSTWEEDIKNTLDCIAQVNDVQSDTDIVHSFIPKATPMHCKLLFEEQLKEYGIKHVALFDRIDIARDGHHYDLLTSRYLVDQILLLQDSNTSAQFVKIVL